MSTSTEPNNVWAFVYNKPAATDASQQNKKSYVTNYVKGQSADLSLPEIATGGVAPFIAGRDIIKSPDMLWYGNLQPIYEVKTEQTTTTDQNTGVDTITSTITTTITGYTVDIQFCAGLGPGVRLRSILLDNVSVWSGTVGPARTDFVVPDNDILKNVTFAGGNFDQAVDTYLQSKIPQAISGYRGIAYVVLKALDTTKLGNLSFEVDRYPDPLALGAHNKIGDDLNTVSAIAEIITRKWGGAGRDPAILGDSFAALAQDAFTQSNGCSVISRQINSANDLNGILLDQLDATLWEDHELGTIEITQYNKNFDRENLVRVFDKDIIKIDSMQKTGWAVVPTSLTLKYVDRAQNYAEIPIAAKNLATSGKIPKSSKELSFPAVRSAALAVKLLAREGASSGSPVQQISLTTNRKTAKSNPGDIILITCEDYGYYSVPGIVVKRRAQPIDDNSVTLVVNVILYPNNNVLFAAPLNSFFVPVDPNPHTPLDVVTINAPWAFVKKAVFNYSGVWDYNWLGQYSQMMFFAEAYNNSQIAMRLRYHDVPTDTDVRVYTNNANLSDFNYPAFAKLTTAIDKYDNWDNSSDVEQIVVHNISLNNLGIQTAINNFNIGGYAHILIDDEIFIIKHGDVSSSIVYNEGLRTATFTGVRRAIADTVAQSHAANADVIISSFGKLVMTSDRGFTFGDTIDFLATSVAAPKNVLTESGLGAAFAFSEEATDRAYRPLRPHNTKINAARGTSAPTALTLGDTPTISWAVRARTYALSFTPYGDFPTQTEASQAGEVLAGKHIVYRVKLIDSAAVAWDCGATADTADHSSLVVTIPLGAAVGAGWLYVQAEFDPGDGVKVSLYQDRLPVTLS
jgi:hypothetical protein